MTPWAEQRAILEYMDQAEDIPFGFQLAPGAEGEEGPAVRENVDAGVDVIDLNEFRLELELTRGQQGQVP